MLVSHSLLLVAAPPLSTHKLVPLLKTPTMTTNKKSGDWSTGTGVLPGRAAFGPLALMTTTPCFSIIYFHVCTQMDGDFFAFAQVCIRDGLISTLQKIWPDPWDSHVWTMILSFLSFQLFLMKVVPGKRMEGTVTARGNVPVYTANGTACYWITLLTLLLLAQWDLFDPASVYDNYGKILASMNVFAWCFCTMLLIKGYVAPSTSDSGTTGSLILDFFWGMELYPRIAGWDVKMFTNCRAGMMFWAVAIVSFCYKNMQLHQGQLQLGLAVSVGLQLIYISKFYHWEMGYMRSMDIQHDRAGYYICWGCLVWVPSVYTSQAFYLTAHAPTLSIPLGMAIFLAGLLCIWINYDSDRQRYIFRNSGGQCKIWGRIPRKIVATYTINDNDTTNPATAGKPRQSLLLVDGWWKLSRHFHYVPEILASFFWSVSALDTGFVGPYFYTIYLTILLTDRAFRDDDRCRKKYGEYWEEYCRLVPFKILPGVI